jgi:hypothetical protein
MSLLPPITVPPDKSNLIFRIQNTGKSLPLLSIGEIVEAEIIEKLGDNNVLVSVKGRRIVAGSTLNFKRGERITVRVDQTGPHIIFRPAQTTAAARIPHNLASARFHPGALIDLFVEAAQIFDPESMGDLALRLDPKQVETIHNLLQSLILSKSSLNNSFFKGYLYTFGYLMEKELSRALDKKFGRAAAFKQASQNVKGVLLTLKNDLQNIIKNGDAPGTEKILKYVDSSLNTIEEHQVTNIILQEREQGYLFQIPILYQDGLGLAEVILKFGDSASRKKKGRRIGNVVFLLSMDALGDICVEAKIEAGRIGCEIICENQNIRDFIVPFLHEIKGRLSDIGYTVGHINCSVEGDMEKKKQEHEIRRHINDQGSVNVVA